MRRKVLLIGLLIVGLWFGAQSAQRPAKALALADEMPRGALLYAQFSNWPEALRAWQSSALKSRYEQSLNYQQLWERHLLNKLHERWQEFNAAAGVEFNADLWATLAGERAALAIYDFRRLELVWLAPMNNAQQAACALLKEQGNFEERETADGVTYFIQSVAADNGREGQAIAFALVKDRFVLATSERWLVRTLATMRKPASKDALSAEPKFAALRASLTPHFVTVWTDQERLNQDYYFRHYWLMDNLSELKHLRAGLFDLEMQAGRWIERREFLTDGRLPVATALPREAWARAAAFIPADAPYVSARAGADETLVRDLRDALFSRLDAPPSAQRVQQAGWRWRRYRDYEEYGVREREWGAEEDGSEYGSLDYRYNETIDDPEDADEGYDTAQLAALRSGSENKFAEGARRALQAAQPQMQVRVQRVRSLNAPLLPLLADFQHGVIVSLANPSGFDSTAWEAALIELGASRLMIAGARPALTWRSTQQGQQARELALPWLGRSLRYVMRGSELLVTDSAELMQDCLAHKGAAWSPQANANEFTVIRLSERASAFDRVFAKLDAPQVKKYWQERRGKDYTGKEASQEFFSGNLASLLDVAAPVREITVQRQVTKDRVREVVSLRMTQ
ncbi:MAG: hypothetical protein HOP19_04015 [Acidobacteria bacterium]|nr:hypothetical protein [Acidobacteriota bacterium]